MFGKSKPTIYFQLQLTELNNFNSRFLDLKVVKISFINEILIYCLQTSTLKKCSAVIFECYFSKQIQTNKPQVFFWVNKNGNSFNNLLSLPKFFCHC